jgi:hypothetical protein
MQKQLSSAMSQLSFDNSSRRPNSNPPVSPSPRNSRHLDASTIQAMFPDAAAALAHQRTLLNSNRNSMNGLPAPAPSASTAPRSPGLQAAKDAWPISSTETPISGKIRPHSAEVAWQVANAVGATPAQVQPIKSPPMQPQNTPSIAEDLTSPFGIPGGASWASMVNTPVVPMFQNPHVVTQRNDDLANTAAMKLAAWNTNKSSVSGGVINLDSDVRKFRRGRAQQPTSQQPDTLSTPLGARDTSPTNILMYDERGQLLQFAPHQLAAMRGTIQSPLAAQQSRSRPTSPYPPGFAQFQTLGVSSPIGLGVGPQTYLQPYDSSPVLASSEFAQGYLSDHTSDRRGAPSPSFPRGKYAQNNAAQKRSVSTGKHVEDPVDPLLLNDIPAWLRSLRLHKYTDNLADVKGGVLALAQFTDEDLEKRGVSAVGARRKLLKCFEQVKNVSGTPALNDE